MIKKITLKNTASFKNPSTLETDKRINLMYGLNGTGKTTITNYLKTLNPKQEENTENPSGNLFGDCSIDDFDGKNTKILVYNQNFIKKNFYESETQNGIFTLAQENKEALQAIKDAEFKNKQLGTDEEKFRKNLEDKKKEIISNASNTQEETWKIIQEDKKTGDNLFDKNGFFQGLNSKQKLFSHLKDIPLDKPTKSINEIKSELAELGGSATPRETIAQLKPHELTTLEQNGIFQEEIIGNKNSTVSTLIKELRNSDWVKKGLEEYVNLEKRSNCPFCQQETLTDALVEDIENYFDDTYKEKINTLNSLKTNYQSLKNNLSTADAYTKDFFTEEQRVKIESLFKDLERILKDNLQSIEKKINQPSTPIEIRSSTDAIEAINDWIKKRNDEINTFNNKLQNKEKTKENLKTEFWKIQRNEYKQTIEHYHKQEKTLADAKNDIQKSINNIEAKITEQDKTITENQKKVTNIDKTIEAINKHLLDFGIQNFQIVKHRKDEYKIQRGEEHSEEIFKSLSEGEKTVISFLYFIELCKGKESPTDTKQKIIVIDDPVSSLSHMYVFNVAQLIKSTFFNSDDFLQCFVLTHSLYFFHELVRNNKEGVNKKQKLFRIEKSTESKILKMERDEIQNEYESYWHMVNTATQENIVIVANAMRNIIEYFFNFIERRNTMPDIFQKDEFKKHENKFQAFQRYINRESHSDSTNIYDYKEYDLENFREAFKQVFETSGYAEHYNTFSKIGNSNQNKDIVQ